MGGIRQNLPASPFNEDLSIGIPLSKIYHV